MFTRTILAGSVLFVLVFGSAAVLGQEKAAAPSSPGVREFPVTMQQNVTAGVTSVGTKISAKLLVATLVDGVVFPRNAVFSGEVTESVAKSATQPSRLAIRMDSVQWKNGLAPIRVYLAPWYYPTRIDEGQNLAYGPTDTSVNSRTWNGAGTYPDPKSPASQPFPGRDSDRNQDSVPNTSLAINMDHRVMMKNVESARNNDGSVAITCTRSNIKLDKLTAYVLATGALGAGK
jgi:hypothetical protein